ncbi:hypothetical protein ACLKA7_012556 [Drosophila subpalustris]
MTELEQPPQNGIDPTAGEDDENNKARPADIEQDMREMERRKRVEAIMGSKLFREELERIVDSAREGGAGASGILQQLSDIVGVPVNRVSNVFKSSGCMVPINDIRGVESMGYAKGEKILRCKLAATFRLLDLNGWTQGLGAQITARLKVDQEYFLVNPYGLLYHEITASALNKVDMQGQIVEQGTTNFGVNKSHFVLHSVVHAARPDIRCAIYIGCSPVVAISSLKSGLLALTKDACVLGEISTHAYTGLFDEDERNRLVRNLGPNSKVMLLANHGALCCGETIEEAFYAACHIVQACETQLKLLPVGVDNLVLIPEESRKLIYDQSRRPPEDLEKKFAAVTTEDDAAGKEEVPVHPKIGSPPKWRVGGAEFEALMRMLDNAGYRTGYIYRHPLIKSDPPKPKNDVELPPAVSSLGYLLEEEELFRQGIWKKGDLRKGGDRSRWLNSPNVYQKVEVLETGTPDPKKITKWVAEGSPTHSTPVRIEDPLQFVPAGTTTKEFKRVQQQIKDNRRADKISAGPQSHILEGVTWDEANRIKDATVSQTGDHVVLMGAASKGIIQRGFQHNATVYKAPYAKNPFDNVTDDELNEYKRTVERKKKSIHGEYTDTDFSESEALNSMQAAGAHAHAKHAQSEPETEHQVIQIQTQQAPIPSQAEVVLSDATLSFINGERSHTATNRKPPTGRDQDERQICYEVDKKNHKEKQGSSSSTSKCRRDLNSAFVNPNPSLTPCPDLAQRTDHLADPRQIRNDFYTYAYAGVGGAGGGSVSLGCCCQPQICSVLLQALHSEHLSTMSYHRGSPTSSTVTTTNTNDSLTPRRPLQLTNVVVPPPYRTCSHFGFNSPRQTPRAEHRHMPAGSECVRYRPMHRVISYEEIFATPRYEQLCHSCFEQLLRLKPELQRRSAPSSSVDDPDELISYPSSSVTPRKLTTLTETNDEGEEELEVVEYAEILELPSTLCHASTQTGSSFLRQLERLNFSEESTNVGYVPGLQISDFSLPGAPTTSSPAASATSEPPLKSLAGRETKSTITDITEVWNFGNWQQETQQHEDREKQQPLTERHITLEITQQFNATEEQDPDEDQQAERQLMSRDERQRRKTEFEELWQDHVQYFGAKEKMEQEVPPAVEEETQEEETLWTFVQAATQAEQVEVPTEDGSSPNEQAAGELPKIFHDFEQSLSAAGDNLEKLVAIAKKLSVQDTKEEAASALEESMENGSLFRAISLENIAEADDAASVSEPQQLVTYTDDDDDEEEEAQGEQEEKRDDEKPVTPSPEVGYKDKDKLECAQSDEKDVDENENEGHSVKEVEEQEEEEEEEQEQDGQLLASPTSMPSGSSTDNGIFSPLEREILQRIEADKLKERESIFGRIDASIRNKFTPSRLQSMASSDVEETFSTCTHIFRSPPPKATTMTPHLFQFSSEPRPSAYTMHHNIEAPSSSSAHVHVITGQAPRLSRSWTSYQESSEQASNSPSQSQSPSQSTSSLDSSLSSKTFVCRRQKRNFIQENIRNASKPRACASTALAANRKTRRPEIPNDASNVCTFQQAEERGSSARLWVTLPMSPRSVIGQKRRSPSPNRAVYSNAHSSCSPYGKRRKPIGIHVSKMRRIPHSVSVLQKSVSSSTFFAESCELSDNVGLVQVQSNTTFELDEEEEEPQNVTLKPETVEEEQESGEDRVNATNSTMYYSAKDCTLTEAQRSSQDMEMNNDNNTETLQMRLSGGETTEEAGQTDVAEESVENVEYIEYTSYNDEMSDPTQSTSNEAVAENDNNQQEEDNIDPTLEETLMHVNVGTDPVEEHATNSSSASNADGIEETDAQTSSLENVYVALANESNMGVVILEEIQETTTSNTTESEGEMVFIKRDDEMNVINTLEANSSSAFSLSPIPATFDLGSKAPNNSADYESDSSSLDKDKEFVLAKDENMQIPVENESEEDDNKPNTSAAAAKKRKSKKKSGKTKDDDVVVLRTQCQLKDGTLQITEEEPLDDIQIPRCANHDRNMMKPYNSFLDYDDLNIFDGLAVEAIAEDLDDFEEEETISEFEITMEKDSDSEHDNEGIENEQLRIELDSSVLLPLLTSAEDSSYLSTPVRGATREAADVSNNTNNNSSPHRTFSHYGYNCPLSNAPNIMLHPENKSIWRSVCEQREKVVSFIDLTALSFAKRKMLNVLSACGKSSAVPVPVPVPAEPPTPSYVSAMQIQLEPQRKQLNKSLERDVDSCQQSADDSLDDLIGQFSSKLSINTSPMASQPEPERERDDESLYPSSYISRSFLPDNHAMARDTGTGADKPEAEQIMYQNGDDSGLGLGSSRGAGRRQRLVTTSNESSTQEAEAYSQGKHIRLTLSSSPEVESQLKPSSIEILINVSLRNTECMQTVQEHEQEFRSKLEKVIDDEIHYISQQLAMQHRTAHLLHQHPTEHHPRAPLATPTPSSSLLLQRSNSAPALCHTYSYVALPLPSPHAPPSTPTSGQRHSHCGEPDELQRLQSTLDTELQHLLNNIMRAYALHHRAVIECHTRISQICENVQNGDHSEAHLSTFSQSSKEDVSTDGSPKKDKKKKKGLRTPSFLKKKKEKKKAEA